MTDVLDHQVAGGPAGQHAAAEAPPRATGATTTRPEDQEPAARPELWLLAACSPLRP
jgi:hypothetical protein